MPVKIYGASDDLLELEGDISEEIGVDCNEVFYIGISDGTLLRVEYDDYAIWRIDRVRKGFNNFEKVLGDPEEDTNDIATIHGELSWILIGSVRILNKKLSSKIQ